TSRRGWMGIVCLAEKVEAVQHDHKSPDRLSYHRDSSHGASYFNAADLHPDQHLNYIGVPREKNNQVPGMSNFARNLGGGIGTSLLGVFLAWQNQTYQASLIAHTSHGDPNFDQWLAGLKGAFIGLGYEAT